MLNKTHVGFALRKTQQLTLSLYYIFSYAFLFIILNVLGDYINSFTDFYSYLTKVKTNQLANS